MRTILAKAILRVLRDKEGAPLPEQELCDGVCEQCRSIQPTTTDVLLALTFCAEQQWVQGLSDALSGRSWSLTESGRHCAARL
jgi:hypothetical protein